MDFVTYHKETFNRIGWFIPPYVTFGFIGNLAKQIRDTSTSFGQSNLAQFLAQIYAPVHLAAMVTERYPLTLRLRAR